MAPSRAFQVGLLASILIVSVEAGADPPQFCVDCCDAARGFGFNGGEASCCELGCALEVDSGCDSEKQLEAFNAGVSIVTDITQNFLIDGDPHVCFEDPPGTFNVAEATLAPTNAPTIFVQDDAALIASLTVIGALAGLAGLVYYRRRDRGDADGDVETPPLKTTKKMFGINGHIGSMIISRAKIPGVIGGGPRIVSEIDTERTFRSGILSYKQVSRPSFESVNARRYKEAVSRTERTSFHQFKRLSTTTSSTRSTLYFVDSTLLDTGRIIEKVTRKVKRALSFKRNDDGFSGIVEPEISLEDFLLRLVFYLDEWYNDPDATEKKPSGVNSLIISIVYQARMKARLKTFALTPYNVHRVFAVTMLLAAKFSEDEVITNKYWSEVSLISLEELNKIEGAFCSALNFNLYVSPEEFKDYSTQYLPSKLQQTEGLYGSLLRGNV